MSERTASTTRSILVVEDEGILRDVAVAELEDAGYRVVSFSCADDALGHLALNAHDTALLFTDVQMPGRLNGLELTAIVSRTWPAIPVLLTSGGSLVNPIRLPSRVQYVPKPWRGSDLVARVAAMTGGASLAPARLDAAML